MLKNYLKIAWRNITRHKAYSLINISGLAIGMACSIMILLWVQQELSYDRFHANASRIYRITCNAGDFKAAINPAGMPFTLKDEMPIFKQAVRLSELSTDLFEVGDKKFIEKKVFYADSTFLDVFSFALMKGDRKTAMLKKENLLLTEDMAIKYFGHLDVIGKTLRQNNGRYVTITGLFKNIPSNSHLQFDFIMPMSAIAEDNDDIRDNKWGNFNFYSYLEVNEAFTATKQTLAAAEKQMDKIYIAHDKSIKVNFQLQPLTDIHLHSKFNIDVSGHGNNQYVTIFMMVAIFILIVASINFMNLATARSARRAKEVGIRKVAGAIRGQLILQFLGEAILISLIAFLLAIGFVFLCLPMFNTIAGKRLAIDFTDLKLWLGLVGIALATGLVSGSYPALYLSGFIPVKVLKGSVSKGAGNLLFRNILVVIQFIVSIILLAGTIVVFNQLKFIRNQNLGFDRSNLLYMPMSGDLYDKHQALRSALENNPLTSKFAIMSELPTNLTSGTVDASWEGKDPKSQVVIPSVTVNEGFFDVFQMTMLSGRGFTTSFKGDSSNFVINETMLHLMNLKQENAVGKPLTFDGRKGFIIGVVKDFNFKPIQQSIEPLVIELSRSGGYVIVRTTPGNTESTIASLKRINAELNPAFPFNYNFLDQDLANLYKGEQQLGKLFNIFAILAIFISCLGLYGLSAFMAEQRKREIGVRKVLGASAINIVMLMSSAFTRLIVIAIIIAVPLSWYFIHSWLEGFAYHVNAGWTIFLTASLSALFIAWLTVGYESLKSALRNPVKSLRAE